MQDANSSAGGLGPQVVTKAATSGTPTRTVVLCSSACGDRSEPSKRSRVFVSYSLSLGFTVTEIVNTAV